MSGTSLDGVDGVVAQIPDSYSGGALQMLAEAYVAFPAELRSELMALQVAGANEIEREARAAHALVQAYSQCVAQLLENAGVAQDAVRAIGVHGQTIRHRPELNFTRQINNPALLAELTGIDVIADFRSRDIAAGGQGAPLVPAFHQAVFGKSGETRVVVNIGGISNISVLHSDGNISGFDTGPGNMLMDAWVARHRGLEYDAGGAWAASGDPIPDLLSLLMLEPYFSLPQPKSTGRDLFHLDWLLEHLREFEGARAEDVQATLSLLTVTTIAEAIFAIKSDIASVYVCGGGAYNAHLMQRLQDALQPRSSAASTEVLGISPHQVEALAFAWLAQRFCLRQPGNLPDVTGAKGARILGAWYPA